MSKKLIVASIVLFVSLAPLTHAVTSTTSESAKPRANKEEIMKRKEFAQTALQEHKENREELQNAHREKINSLREEFEAKRSEFATKLQALKDQRKKLIVERVDKRLATINQNWAQRMNKAILKLEALLEKFSVRAEKLNTEGRDTTAVDSAISEAETAITAAKEAVATQEAKEYVADLTDETNLKSSVGESMTGLRNDLKSTHEIIKIAKQKVIDVAKALAKLSPSTEPSRTAPTHTGTPSATLAPGI